LLSGRVLTEEFRFNVPPFFVDRFQALGITIQIAAHQIEYACTAILVFKDLLKQQNRKIHTCYPA